MARRDALTAQRKKLETRLGEIDSEIKDLTQTGADPAKLDKLSKERAEVASKIENDTREESSLSNELGKVLSQSGDIAGREAAMAERERRVAAREAAVAVREARGGGGGGLDEQLISRLESACKSQAPAAMIITAPSGGGKYTRSEADSALSRARKVMRDKGLIPGDLWAGASLESATTAAMSKNEWSAAVSTASELVRVANEFRITPEFVRTKMKRLDAAVKSTKRDEAVKKQIENLLGEVVNQFSSGNHNAANAKLNQGFGLVR